MSNCRAVIDVRGQEQLKFPQCLGRYIFSTRASHSPLITLVDHKRLQFARRKLIYSIRGTLCFFSCVRARYVLLYLFKCVLNNAESWPLPVSCACKLQEAAGFTVSFDFLSRKIYGAVILFSLVINCAGKVWFRALNPVPSFAYATAATIVKKIGLQQNERTDESRTYTSRQLFTSKSSLSCDELE